MMFNQPNFSLNVFGARNSLVHLLSRDCQCLLASRKSNSILPVFEFFLILNRCRSARPRSPITSRYLYNETILYRFSFCLSRSVDVASEASGTINLQGQFRQTYYNCHVCYIASRGLSTNAIDLRWEDQKMPRFKFPKKFSLSYNETHYSNEKEACKFIEEILQPYIKKVIEPKNLPVDQKSLVIMDVFKGQVTPMKLNL